jgi:eukaryotic-like serine/threonine-protein kinase
MTQYSHSGEPVQPEPQLVTVGRYVLHRQIARGGMATIHIARLMGDEGFSRIVAAKRLLPEFAEDPEFVAMFLDEARIASRIHHRNVVPVLDVVTTGAEVILVQEYVRGVPLYWLLRAAQRSRTRVPLDIAVSIACQVLAGLHAAHETLDEMGSPLHVVHRDVSPQNVMIAVDGAARLLDFGVAKATMTAHITRHGQFKGKLAYAAPEQLYGHAARQSDLYALSALLWEIVVGHGIHDGVQGDAELIATIMRGGLPTITQVLAAERDAIGPERWRQLEAIEPIVRIGLSFELTQRWPTAADMEKALARAVRPASSRELAAWLRSLGREFIDKHERVLAAEEASWRRLGVATPRFTPVLREQVPEPSARLQTPVPSVLPVAQRWRVRSSTWIAALCGVVAAIAIVLAIGVSSTGTAAVTPVAPPTVAPPPTVTPIAPAPASPSPVELPSSEVTPPLPSIVVPAVGTTTEPVEPAAGVTMDAVEPVVGATTDSVEPAAADPARRGRIRRKPPPVVIPAEATDQPPFAEPPAADCRPPYYYDGAKKIFKPACI